MSKLGFSGGVAQRFQARQRALERLCGQVLGQRFVVHAQPHIVQDARQVDGILLSKELVPVPPVHTALKDAGADRSEVGRAAARAKLFATEAGLRICEKAARVMASYGYAMEYPVQRFYRDALTRAYFGLFHAARALLFAEKLREEILAPVEHIEIGLVIGDPPLERPAFEKSGCLVARHQTVAVGRHVHAPRLQPPGVERHFHWALEIASKYQPLSDKELAELTNAAEQAAPLFPLPA